MGQPLRQYEQRLASVVRLHVTRTSPPSPNWTLITPHCGAKCGIEYLAPSGSQHHRRSMPQPASPHALQCRNQSMLRAMTFQVCSWVVLTSPATPGPNCRVPLPYPPITQVANRFITAFANTPWALSPWGWHCMVVLCQLLEHSSYLPTTCAPHCAWRRCHRLA